MSYFDFFSKTFKDSQPKTDVIVGKCYSMCPDEELQLRCRESLVHQLEECSGGGKLVKSFSRSAADSNMAKPHLLRPYAVLKQTVQHLLFEVTKRTEVSASRIYDFVNDRLRAVRQDATIQRLPPGQCMVLLEPMVRFYVYFGYKLSDYPISDYDPVLNRKYLLECLKWFLTCADEVDRSGNVDRLSGIMLNMDMNRGGERLPCNRALMESLYILCHLDDVHPLYRYLNLSKHLKSDPLLVTSYKLSIENLRGNFPRVVRLSATLGPLTQCAFYLYLPTMQKKALHVLSYAYHSKQLSVPCEFIRRALLFDCDRQVVECCTHYGLTVQGDRVHFNKINFRADAELLQIKHLGSDKLEKKIGDLLENETDKSTT